MHGDLAGRAADIEPGTNAAMRAVAGDDAATQLRCRIFAVDARPLTRSSE